MTSIAQETICYGCGNAELSACFVYDRPPPGETQFSFSGTGRYYREVLRCGECGHFMSVHEMDDSELYSQEYVSSTYGDDGFRQTFERIISLPPEKSDNVGRCQRINDFAASFLTQPTAENRARTILDVGSGLCVFLHRMQATGWRGTALDPDPRAAEHARSRVGVEAVCGDFFTADELGRFDVVTFNKVLEHVKDPVSMLAKAKHFVAAGGFVYVELPDGEAAAEHGPGREEFFVEHHHVFSFVSLARLISSAGFTAVALERLREPSGKYTLRAFCTA